MCWRAVKNCLGLTSGYARNRPKANGTSPCSIEETRTLNYTMSGYKGAAIYTVYTCTRITSSINRFSIFDFKLGDKSAIKLCLIISPLLKHVATVPWEISVPFCVQKSSYSASALTKLPFKTETVEICKKNSRPVIKHYLFHCQQDIHIGTHYKFLDQQHTTVATKKKMQR